MAAHYDTVPGSPGADDNAGFLPWFEVARLLGSRPTRTLQLAFFSTRKSWDCVGHCLCGSKRAENLRGNHGYGRICLLYTRLPGIQLGYLLFRPQPGRLSGGSWRLSHY